MGSGMVSVSFLTVQKKIKFPKIDRLLIKFNSYQSNTHSG